MRGVRQSQVSWEIKLALLQAATELGLFQNSTIALLGVGTNVDVHKLVVAVNYIKQDAGVCALQRVFHTKKIVKHVGRIHGVAS